MVLIQYLMCRFYLAWYRSFDWTSPLEGAVLSLGRRVEPPPAAQPWIVRGFKWWQRPESSGARTEEAKMPSRRTKIDSIRKLLSRPTGASIAQLQKTTGWQPHSVRAALTRLRQKGHAVKRCKDNGRTTYRIATKS